MAEDVAAREEVEGSVVTTLEDGTTWVAGPTRLVAPTGECFGIDWELGQAEERGPVTVVMRVLWLDEPLMGAAEAASTLRAHGSGLSEEALSAYEAGYAAPVAVVPTRSGPLVGESLRDWPAAAAADETTTVVGRLANAPALEVPPSLDALLETDPVAALDRVEEQTLALLDYQAAVAAHQAPVAAELSERGIEILTQIWLSDSLVLSVTADALDELTESAQFEALSLVGEIAYDSNDGVATRTSTQTQPFLDAGYDASHATGYRGRSQELLMVVDDCIDEDHPAWNDASGDSRLDAVWVWSGPDPAGNYTAGLLPSGDHSAAGLCHGMGTTGILASDLTQGQDPGLDPSHWSDASGVALGGHFEFEEKHPNGLFGLEMSLVAVRLPDVLSLSYSYGSNCDLDAANNAEVDNLYNLGVLVVKSAGNYGHAAEQPCSVGGVAVAGGALVAGAISVGQADLNAGPLAPDTSIGGDVHGRAIVDLVAPGRETSWLPMYDDAYQTTASFGATSAAAPTVAGAAAILKDFLANVVDGTLANTVGLLHATMLLMGDGTLTQVPCNVWGGVPGTCHNPGPVAVGGAALDPRWGAGRMRMRLFNDTGMDHPWRARWCTRSVSAGTVTSCKVNPDVNQVNQPLDADVERLRVAAWWFEPNLETDADPANIGLAAIRDGVTVYGSAGVAPGEKRLREDTAGGSLWEARLLGWCVPPDGAIFDPANPYGNCNTGGTRTVYVGMYWEDMDRDESPNPPASIQ